MSNLRDIKLKRNKNLKCKITLLGSSNVNIYIQIHLQDVSNNTANNQMMMTKRRLNLLLLSSSLSLSFSGPISGVTSDGRAGRLLSNPLGLKLTNFKPL